MDGGRLSMDGGYLPAPAPGELDAMAEAMPCFSEYRQGGLDATYFEKFRDKLMQVFEHLRALQLEKYDMHRQARGFVFDPKKFHSFRVGEVGQSYNIRRDEIEAVTIQIGWDEDMDYGGHEKPEIFLAYVGDFATDVSKVAGVSQWREILDECFDVEKLFIRKGQPEYRQKTLI